MGQQGGHVEVGKAEQTLAVIAMQEKALYGPIPVKTKTFREL